MVNGLGVLGWGVGGIEAEAAMLGQPVSMLIPRVVGFKLTGEIKPGVTATDVVLTVTEMLRKHGVVGKFVEFYGEGVAEVPLANRATLGNMSPEFGSTAAIFPIDEVTVDYLRLTGRTRASSWRSSRPTPRHRACGTTPSREPNYSEYLELDLCDVVPSIAGPKRPQDRIVLSESKVAFRKDIHNYVEENHPTPHTKLDEAVDESFPASDSRVAVVRRRRRRRRAVGGQRLQRPAEQAGQRCSSDEQGEFVLDHGAVVDRGDHVVHQHLQPVGDAGCGAAGPQRRRQGPDVEAVGQDVDGARARRSSATTTTRPGSGRTWRSWASSWSATAAPRASATPARCPTRSRKADQRQRPLGDRGALG